MHSQTISQWQHSHNFVSTNPKGEKRTHWVLWLTIITMVAEITAGSLYGSMALLADGWHMGTHAAAFMITIFAYRYARKHADNRAFSFGTGKVSVLGGFTSAIALGLVALLMLVESVQRLFSPETIHFNEAIFVAVIGLTVNIASVFLLKDDHHHSHDHSHSHSHSHDHHHHHDHNLKAAYFHVLADALTSVLAIVALLFGKYYGLHWLDAIMGIVGAVIITRWAWGLMKQTSPILLDGNIDEVYQQHIIDTLEADADSKVSDIHIWKVSANHYAAMISLVTHAPKPAQDYKQLLKNFDKLSHLTIEVNRCQD
ncbi:cation transporter [Photobacterium chitinilyticum]|uniref:Cation transporter n=1 Tax=Photobacterium chitinilyticum TaxID=2485123 RepID=A0A3S3SYR8_9GAMM|nr:cation transporter [Photobacterium chitinilyticum]